MNMASKAAACVVAALTVSSCGPLNEGNVAIGAVNALRQSVTGQPAGAPAPTPAVLTRAQVDAAPGNFLVMNAYGGSLVAPLVPGGTNGNRVTWLGAETLAITLEGGIIAATRGFPRDLMAADVSGVSRTISAGGGNVTRIHETLDDTDQISRQVLQCSIAPQGGETITILQKSFATSRYSETCQSDFLSFTNSYWVDGNGQIVRSLQAIAPEAGYVQLDRP